MYTLKVKKLYHFFEWDLKIINKKSDELRFAINGDSCQEKFMCFSSYNVSPSFLQFGFCFSSFNLFIVFCSFFDSTGRLSYKEWCYNCSIQIVVVVLKTIARTFLLNKQCWENRLQLVSRSTLKVAYYWVEKCSIIL